MFILIACVVVLSATAIAVIRSKKPLKLILAEAKYELLYSAMGSKYMMHDILMRKKNITDLPLKSGKTAVITGGTRGIGLEVIKLLLKCDINVIIGCRNIQQGENLLPKFREEGISTGNIEVFQLDISVLESVRKFAELVKNKHDKIDYLINNAGIMFGSYVESRDGYESQFSTNYLGHFLLTYLLLPNLKKSGTENLKSRIINVSSCAHIMGKINFDDINCRAQYIPGEAYAQSKLAQILFSNHLNELLKKENANVQVHSVHPGLVDTGLFNDTNMKTVAPWLPSLFFKTPERGAYPIIHACLSPVLEGKGGTYIDNCQVVPASDRAENVELQEKLFSFTKKLLDIETKFYVPAKGYAQSKLAQILFSNYLNALLVREQEQVRVYSVHPGVIDTDIMKSHWYGSIPGFVRKFFFRTPEEGAIPVLYACLSKDLENNGGTYIMDSKIHAPSEKAANVKLQKEFFDFSKNLIETKSFSTLE
ncbi:unnamed protein product [Ceutorhynchus assimilis]|uniref:Uncharacterized protein n=1 Tax=Ceutorhynchus assimilis TaxID=467358 RepID=A0A9N9QK61_9CUCU|nr:unnamed protein product [Ceutorhynchus assimilis]